MPLSKTKTPAPASASTNTYHLTPHLFRLLSPFSFLLYAHSMPWPDAAYPKTVALRDGAEVLVRRLAAGDEDALLSFFQAIPEAERFFLKDDVTSPDLIRGWVRDAERPDPEPSPTARAPASPSGRTGGRAFALIALEDERILAEAALVRRRGAARGRLELCRPLLVPGRRLDCVISRCRNQAGHRFRLALDANIRHPFQPSREVPVPVPEQRHTGGHQHHADDRGVNENCHRQAEADFLEDHQIAGSHPREHRDHDQRRAGDDA